MFRFSFFITVLFLCMLLLNTNAQKPAEIHSNSSNLNEDASVISTSFSPFAKLHSIPPRSVNIGDGFWKKRFSVNMERSIPTFFTQLKNVGAFDKLLGRKNKARENSDADLSKWMEATSFVLQSEGNKQLQNILESVVDDIMISGTNGGYLHTRYLKKMPVRLAQFRASGELYCLGHLIQAGIAHYRATGNKRFLNVLIPYIDKVIGFFGSGKQSCWSGHPEIEMALVELYRTTGKKEYLDFVRFLLEEVDYSEIDRTQNIDFEHYFAGVPFTYRRKLSGHAVCALYACCGAADYYLETGDQKIWQALMSLWDDLTKYKMYVTGGVGSRPWDEAIGNRYELPNERGYAETCAAIGNVMWNWRLLNASGEARFTDIMELALYNGVLSGISIDGDKYFYWNPLLSRHDYVKEQYVEEAKDLLALKKSRGATLNIRQPYYRTPCCIPNIHRIIASLPGYMYSTSTKGLWIHLYQNNRLNWHLENGKEFTVRQNTKYPWENNVEIIFENVPAEDFSLFFRVPGWTTSARVSINGRFFYAIHKSSYYHEIRRRWEKNDKLKIEFDMPVRVLHSHPHLRENSGCVAIQRGPLIYCIEGVDQQVVSIFDIVLPLNLSNISQNFKVRYKPNLLGGVVTIIADALARAPDAVEDRLYNFERFPIPSRPVKMIAIPYFAWANRGHSEMEVWIPWIMKQ